MLCGGGRKNPPADLTCMQAEEKSIEQSFPRLRKSKAKTILSSAENNL